jgi:hypothetical protein
VGIQGQENNKWGSGQLKARLVAKGFQQCRGLDIDKTFALIIKWPTICTMVAITYKNH